MRRSLLSGLVIGGVAMGLLGLGGCGGDDAGDVPAVRVDLIDEAVSAVVDELGDVAFFEVNATPDLVNVFVAGTDDKGATTATAYVYEPGGGLGEPADPEFASGVTFVADQIDFDPDTVLDTAVEELPTSVLRVFAINGEPGPDGPAAAVGYRIVFDSAEGGSLSVSVRGDGGIIGVDAE